MPKSKMRQLRKAASNFKRYYGLKLFSSSINKDGQYITQLQYGKYIED